MGSGHRADGKDQEGQHQTEPERHPDSPEITQAGDRRTDSEEDQGEGADELGGKFSLHTTILVAAASGFGEHARRVYRQFDR